MSVKVDDLELNTRKGGSAQESIAELRSIRRIGLLDKRRVNEHRLASTYGSVLSDVGRPAITIVLEGEFAGRDSMESIGLLRSKYKSGKPLSFISDLTLLTQVEKVLMQELQIHNISHMHKTFRYYMVLREYKEPKESADSPDKGPPPMTKMAKQQVDQAVKDAAQSVAADTARDALQTTAQSAAQSLASQAAQATGPIQAAANNISQAVSSQAQQATGAVQSVANSITQAVSSQAQQATGAVQSATNNISQAVSSQAQ